MYPVRTWKNLGCVILLYYVTKYCTHIVPRRKNMRAEPEKRHLDPVLAVYVAYKEAGAGCEIHSEAIWQKPLSEIGPNTPIRISKDASSGAFVAHSKSSVVSCPEYAVQETVRVCF